MKLSNVQNRAKLDINKSLSRAILDTFFSHLRKFKLCGYTYLHLINIIKTYSLKIVKYIQGVSKTVSKTKMLLQAKYLRYLHNSFIVLLEHSSGFCMKILKRQCWPLIFFIANNQFQGKTV